MKFKKGEKNTWVTIIKIVIFVVVLLIQVLFFTLLYKGTVKFKSTYEALTIILQIVSVLYILYGHERLTYKIPWLVFIMFLPIAGIITYLLWGSNRVGKKIKKERDKIIQDSHKFLKDDKDIVEKLKEDDDQALKQVNILRKLTGYSVYENSKITYFDIGEKYFESLLKDIKNAKQYILIEYFIIAKGELFNRLYEVLKEKLNSGVKVIIIADGWGSLLRYPKTKMLELIELGATIKKYNPLRYGINTYINYRDHRKIVVVDGKVAYTGGVNIADEYTNEFIRFGHWKDNGVKIEGDLTQALVIAFLKNYEVVTKKVPDYNWYLINNEAIKNKGYSMFYTDGPDNRKNPAENLYIELINSAKKYVYIYTPYLIPSTEILNAILNAAYSGVDVRIITPHKPDKWYVHMVTKSYYGLLVSAGVKVYEYLPGFLHAKTFISDDNTAVVGSINLDYRSLNLNYECALWMHKTGTEINIKQDFIETMDKSKEITIDEVKNKNIFTKIIEAVLNAFSPLF